MKDFIRKHTHAIVTTITVLLLLGFSYQVMAYLFSLRQEPEKRPPVTPIRSVQCRTVEYGTIVSPVTASGRVVSAREVVLNSEVQGRILEGDVPLKKGQQFNKGDVLIRIFDGNAVMNLRARKSSFLQSIAGILPDLKVDYPGSFDTWNEFFQSIDIDADLPDLPGIRSDQEKIFLASRGILTNYYSIKSDEITLKKYTIRAPFEGTFTEVAMEVGAYTGPGSVLARIIRTDTLEIEVPVEAKDAKWIRIGDKVDVTTEDGSATWEGTVVRTSSFVDVDTQSMSIFVRLPNGSKTPVYKGQYLVARFPGRPIDNAMEAPRNAVFNHNEVFVVEDNKLAMRTIDIHKINEKTLIFSGLEPGDELVVEPLINTMENTRVEISR